MTSTYQVDHHQAAPRQGQPISTRTPEAVLGSHTPQRGRPHGIKEFEAATLAAEQSRIADLVPGPGVETMSSRPRSPAQALLAAAEPADLLIVGTRVVMRSKLGTLRL